MILLDNSAWSHMSRGVAVPGRADDLAVCLPFLLEAGFSAREARDHAEALADLRTLPHLPIDAEVEELSLAAQADLARVGHHRLPPTDLLIAALAARHGAGVLHYDADFDLLREHTCLGFDSVWLAPRGTL